jgi:hypothetical protein
MINKAKQNGDANANAGILKRFLDTICAGGIPTNVPNVLKIVLSVTVFQNTDYIKYGAR